MKIINLLRSNVSSLVILCMAVILLIMAVLVYQSSDVFVKKAQFAKDQNIKLVIVAQQMRVDVIQIQQWLTDISATRAKDGLDDGFAEAEKSYYSFISGIEVFEDFYKNKSKNREMLNKITRLRGKVDSYYLTGQEMARSYIANGPAGGNKVMATFDDAAAALYEQLDPFVNGQKTELSDHMEDIVVSANNLKTIIVSVFSTVFFVSLLGLFIQNRNNQKHINAILETMQDAANGNLTVTMHDKVGRMAKVALAVNNLLTRFSQVMHQVKGNADFVYTSAEEISDGNDNLSRRLQEQASSLEETASSMEEMTSTVQHNANSASEANKLVNSTRSEAEEGGRVMQNAVSAMRDISESSNRIADIIGTIESIAFQTNLLALNAAVEAARAGEQGRGFAVVAAEVRNLAQSSSEAAKQIKTLIEDSVDKVKAGTDQVNSAGQTLLSIVEGIKKVDELMAEINNASQEQSSGINEVNKAVAHMDDRIQQNAAFVEQSSAASSMMREKAQVLNEAIAFFKLGDDADNSVIVHDQSKTLQLERHN